MNEELLRLKLLKEVKEECDKDYAFKIVQHIVFYAVGAVGIAFWGYLISLAFKAAQK